MLVGVALVAISIGGMMISMSGSAWGWGGYMPRFNHLGSWSVSTNPAISIEGATDLTVTADEFSFAPSDLVATRGEALNLILVNDGAITHDLSIPQLGVRIVAAAGQSSSGGLVPETVGSYDVVCTFPGHAASGMTGTLVVQDA